MSSSAAEPTVFGRTYRQHDNRQMQQILRAYDNLPENPTVRSAVYIKLMVLEKNLDQDVIERIKQWMRNGGNIQNFPAPAPAPEIQKAIDESVTLVERIGFAESSLDGETIAGYTEQSETVFEFNEIPSGHMAETNTDSNRGRENEVGEISSPQHLIDPTFQSAEQPKECSICMEIGGPSIFPTSSRITSTCNHIDDSLVCLRCIQETTRTAVRDGAIHRIACPLCPSKLSSHEIGLFSTLEILNRYKYLVMKSTPGLVMCLGLNCGLGQVHEEQAGAPPVMTCNSCGFKTCVVHGLPWHEGQTCVEFDQEETQIERLEADEATAKLLSGSSKICPTCKQGVTKEDGCDHLECRCGEQWCFVCLASWENIVRIGGSAHARTCEYHPARIRLRQDQRDASAARMAELVHGGPVSETLERARVERNAARRLAARSSAAAAAEKRIVATTVGSKNMEGSFDSSMRKKKVKLVPAWEEL